MLIVVLVVAGLLFGFIAGYSRAYFEGEYLVATDDPSLVLLVLYSNDRAVFGVLEEPGGSLTDERVLVNLSEGGPRSLTWTDAGGIMWKVPGDQAQ